MSVTTKAVLGLILVFLLGLFTGALLTGMVVKHKVKTFLQHPGETVSAAVEKQLTGNLNLDATQKQQVHDYFQQNLQQRKQLQMQIQPQVQTLNLQTFEQINAVLRPDQLEKFHQNVDAMRQRFGAKGYAMGVDDAPPAPAK